MFNNLIESTSHAKEFKRRGSFLLFTTITYLVLIAIGGVASIYAYDAHLDTQSTELEITMLPVTTPEDVAPNPLEMPYVRHQIPDNQPRLSTRTELIDSTSNPNNPPENVGTVASSVPPATIHSVIGAINADPPGPPASNRGVPGGTGNTPVVNMADPPPPPPPPPPAVPKVVKISVVLNSKALKLPKPIYPAMAKQIRLSGTVNVQVLIDESGNVIQAKAISGHPLLVLEAQKAAMQALFSPTTIGGQPVKVSGIITYNFVMP